MLITLITVLLLGGSIDDALLDYVAETRTSVKSVITDDERRKDVTSTLNAMKKRVKQRSKAASQTIKQLKKALGDHEVGEQDIDAVYANYFAKTDLFNSDMIDLRFELREKLTREEWQALFGQ